MNDIIFNSFHYYEEKKKIYKDLTKNKYKIYKDNDSINKRKMYDDLDVPVIYFNNLDKTVMISQIQILGTYENNLFIWENNINNNIKEGFIRLNKKILDYAWGSNNPFLKKIFLNLFFLYM